MAESNNETSKRLDWLKAWLNCVAWVYPAFWLLISAVWTVPKLFLAVHRGFHITSIRISPLTVSASIAPRGAADVFPTPWWILLVTISLVLVTLYFLGKRQRMLAGLFVAMLAETILGLAVFVRWFSRDLGAGFYFAVAISFPILLLGVRWMVQAWGGETYFERVLHVTASFVFVPGFLFLALTWRDFWAWRPDLVVTLASRFLIVSGLIFLAVLITALPRRGSLPPVRQAGWKLAAAGLLFTVTIPIISLQEMRARKVAESNNWQKALSAYPPVEPTAPYSKTFFHRGVSFAAEEPGGYQSESAIRILEQLPRYGVNAVALIPYGFEGRGSTDIVIGGSMETDEGLEGLARVAHARGMKVMLKPGMWTEGGSFAGDLDFPDPAARANWFASYQKLVEHYSALATKIHADVFCIGGEFVKLSRYDAEWRRLIARARELYPGPIVYAANFGEEFETLKFWDGLDYIGLQEYYPLPDDFSTVEVVGKVEAVQKKFGKPVLFTEAGFPSAAGANRKPWDDSGGKVDLDMQSRAYDAIFRAFYDKPWFEGVYWWKVGTDGRGGPSDSSHTPWGKPAMQVISRYYLNDKTEDRPTGSGVISPP